MTRYLVCRFRLLSAAMVLSRLYRTTPRKANRSYREAGDMASCVVPRGSRRRTQRETVHAKPTNKYLPKPEQKRLHCPGRAQTKRRLAV